MILEKLSQEIEDFRGSHKETPVKSMVLPLEIRDYLNSNFDFSQPKSLEKIFTDVTEMMRKWSLHVTDPGYFGLFDPEVRLSSIVADALVALYNPQLASWNHAPAANEIERFTLNFMAEQFGLEPETSASHFTSGGAEANLTAVITALTSKFPDYGDKGLRGLSKQPVFYVSEETHHSFNKIAHVTGLGRDSIRVIQTTNTLKMDSSVLKSQIHLDLTNGFEPFMLIGTAGTTSSGTIDPLEELSEVACNNNLWFHVDAAWGGAAVLVPTLKKYLSGIEKADSITCDAHKWLSVPMGAGMFFSKNKTAVAKAFRVATAYMPDKVEGTEDQYHNSLQWSRRFIGLKLFMSLSELGKSGIQDTLEQQTFLGEQLRKLLEENGWEILNSTPLPVICFTHWKIRDKQISIDYILNSIYKDGDLWISDTRIHNNQQVLRACVTNFRSTEKDVQRLVAKLNHIIDMPVEMDQNFLDTDRNDHILKAV